MRTLFQRHWNKEKNVNENKATNDAKAYHISKIFLFASPLIRIYIMTQVILVFWSVIAYDLLEDRCTIDVIIKKLFPLPF